ncbi:MAG: response regulator [Armatimonadetes bacterium]|nr:response regulator [Armatimonadota bacterium]
MRILCVDDDPATRALLKRALEAAGYEVIPATGGDEAIRIWEEQRPQIVITDWVMPGADGEQLCRHIRAAHDERYTYIIMLTVKELQEDVLAGLRAGADDYIKKPFDRHELVQRVKAGHRIIRLETTLAEKIGELREALGRVRTLEGILPTCSYCGKIRDEDGNWHTLESYIRHTTLAEFSHGYCPECAAKHVLPHLRKEPE